ncbi:MAG: hypothetical protein Q9161_002902 [Pseudevernia consocians]
MAVCAIDGNTDMYGIGIRIGFYLQWYGAIFASWLAPSEVETLRFTITIYIAATFVALIAQVARDVDNLDVVEVPNHIDALQRLQSVFNVAVASTLLAATELTIRWNKIKGINTLSSAGQTIPFLIGVGALARILFVYRYGPSPLDDIHSYRKPGLASATDRIAWGMRPRRWRLQPEDRLPLEAFESLSPRQRHAPMDATILPHARYEAFTYYSRGYRIHEADMLALTTSVLFYENFAKEALFTYARHQFLKDDRLLRLATRIVEMAKEAGISTNLYGDVALWELKANTPYLFLDSLRMFCIEIAEKG